MRMKRGASLVCGPHSRAPLHNRYMPHVAEHAISPAHLDAVFVRRLGRHVAYMGKAGACSRAATRAVGGGKMSSRLERILVIDDEPQIHRLLRAVLGGAGYGIERADTAAEGLRLARTRSPDTILLDLGLPDLSGHEVLGKLRGFTEVPVLVLSARGAEADKIAALDAGADDYVVKPFYVGELLARIRVAMRHQRAQQGVADVLQFRGLEVDFARRSTRVGGVRVPLTAKEWALLSILARNAGRVVTHRELLLSIWGPAQAENPQYLRVYVGTLRAKLGEAGQLIATETAVGYRMADPL